MPTLDESVEGIIDAVVAAIQLAVDESANDLKDVQSVVRGDRARPMPDLPSLWVVPQSAQMVRDVYGDEAWSLPLSIAGLVKSAEPEEGGRIAQRLTALARGAALTTKGNISGAAVTDVVSTSFDPTARQNESNKTLYWCEAVVTVTFSVDE